MNLHGQKRSNGGLKMLKTTLNLVNKNEIEEIITEIVRSVYDNIKDEAMLLYLKNHEIDLYVAVTDNDEFEEAILKNFEVDEENEIIDEEGYQLLMDELNDYFVELHKTSGLFDFFPSGIYEVNGEKRLQESDCIATKGRYIAPFEDAIVYVN
jgi:hypothetical protein